MSKSNPYAPKTLQAKNVGKVKKKEADPVVDGTIKEVMAWVGEDSTRAERALEAEEAKKSPRATLIKNLKALLGVEED